MRDHAASIGTVVCGRNRIVCGCFAAPALWRRFKRLTQLGWPRRFPILQFPNAPLIAAFIAGQVAGQTHGAAHAYASAISTLVHLTLALQR